MKSFLLKMLAWPAGRAQLSSRLLKQVSATTLIACLSLSCPYISAAMDYESFDYALAGNAVVDPGESKDRNQQTPDLPRHLISIDIRDTESEVLLSIDNIKEDSHYSIDTLLYADALGTASLFSIDGQPTSDVGSATSLGIEDGLWHHLIIDITAEEITFKVDGNNERNVVIARDASASSSVIGIAGIKGRLDQLSVTTQYTLTDGRKRSNLLGAMHSTEQESLARAKTGAEATTSDAEINNTLQGDDSAVNFASLDTEPDTASDSANASEEQSYILTNVDDDSISNLDRDDDGFNNDPEVTYDDAQDQNSLGFSQHPDDGNYPFDEDAQVFFDESLLTEELLEEGIDESQYSENTESDYSDSYLENELLDQGQDLASDDYITGTATADQDHLDDNDSDVNSRYTPDQRKSDDNTDTSDKDLSDDNESGKSIFTSPAGFPVVGGNYTPNSTGDNTTTNSNSETETTTTNQGETGDTTTPTGTGTTEQPDDDDGGGGDNDGDDDSSTGSSQAVVAKNIEDFVNINLNTDDAVIAWFRLDGDRQPFANSSHQIREIEFNGNAVFDPDTFRWSNRDAGEAVRVQQTSDFLKSVFDSKLLMTADPDVNTLVIDSNVTVSAMIRVENWLSAGPTAPVLSVSNDTGQSIALIDAAAGPSININGAVAVESSVFQTAFTLKAWHYVSFEFNSNQFQLFVDDTIVAETTLDPAFLFGFNSGTASIQIGSIDGWIDELVVTREVLTETGMDETTGVDIPNDSTTDSSVSAQDPAGVSDSGDRQSNSTALDVTSRSGTTWESVAEYQLESNFEETQAKTGALMAMGAVNFDTANATATQETAVAARFYGQGDELYTRLPAILWPENRFNSELRFSADLRVLGFDNDRRVPMLQLRGQSDAWFSIVLEPDQLNDDGQIAQYGGSSLAGAGQTLINSAALENVLADTDWHTIQFTMTETDCTARVDDEVLLSHSIDCSNLLDLWRSSETELVTGNFDGWVRNIRIEILTRME